MPCLTLFSVTTTFAMPMLTELTSMVAAPKPTMVVPDASRARPKAALAAIVAALLLLLHCGFTAAAAAAAAGPKQYVHAAVQVNPMLN